MVWRRHPPHRRIVSRHTLVKVPWAQGRPLDKLPRRGKRRGRRLARSHDVARLSACAPAPGRSPPSSRTSISWGGGTTADPLNWGFPILERDSTGAVPVLPVGNALPAFRWSLSQNFRYKRLTAFALLDATVGKDVWNIGRQWSLGDFMHRDTDQSGRSVADARPLGYYFRAVSTGGIGGLYDVLAPNNNTVEDASFVKLREFSVGYRLGPVAGVGNWNVSLIGRNLLTFTNYKGFDPEVGAGGGALGSGVLNAIDNFQFPNLRQFTFSLGTSF